MRSMLDRRALAEGRARACGARAAVRREVRAVAGKRGLPRGRAPGFMCNAAAEFFLAFDNTFLFPEHERCVLASCPSMRLRTCSVVGTYLTLTSCGCFDRDEANPPTRFLSSGEVSDLVRLMTGSDANYLRIVPFDVAQRTVRDSRPERSMSLWPRRHGHALWAP